MLRAITFLLLLKISSQAFSKELVSVYITNGNPEKYEYMYQLHARIEAQDMNRIKSLPDGQTDLNVFCAQNEGKEIVVSYCGKLGKVDHTQLVVLDYQLEKDLIPQNFSGKEDSIMLVAAKSSSFSGKLSFKLWSQEQRKAMIEPLIISPEKHGFVN